MTNSKWGTISITVLCLLVALVSYRFMFLDLKLSYPDMIPHIEHRQLMFLAHIAASPLALIFGIANLLERRKSLHRNFHRWNGRLYVLSVLVGGISGLALAYDALGGTIAEFGFGILSVLWLFVTFNAVRHARARNFVAHRRWMIRSFALTFAAVTLRLYLPFFFFVAKMDYVQASLWVAWLCWVPNIIVAEWWLSRDKA